MQICRSAFVQTIQLHILLSSTLGKVSEVKRSMNFYKADENINIPLLQFIQASGLLCLFVGIIRPQTLLSVYI